MANGHVVIDRLMSIESSLKRAIENVQSELKHREEDASYKPSYLSELSELRSKAESLEDAIRVQLNYAHR